MSRIKKIVLLGGGGHARVVLDAVKKTKEFRVYGIIDPALPVGMPILGANVLGPDDMILEIFRKGVRYAFIGIGSIGNCSVRKKAYDNLKKIGFELPSIAHPQAIIAKDVTFGEGAFVAAGAVINTGARIGRNAIINTNSSVDHDCIIGDFAHIAPGVTLSGTVSIGDEAHVGTGASVIQNIRIGKRCRIAAGTTVCKDMADDTNNFTL